MMEVKLTPQNTVHCGRFSGPEQICSDCGLGLRDRIHSERARTWREIEQIETTEVPNPYEGL